MNAAEIIAGLGGRRGAARCPAHKDRSPSMSVSDSRDGKVLVHCHAGCAQRDVIAALQGLDLWPETAALPPPTAAERERRRQEDQAREAERVRRAAFIERTWQATWSGAEPAPGSPIETWLRARDSDPKRLDLDRLPLRWAPRCPLGKGTAPAMVALMTNAITAEPCGIHRTFLLRDGSAKAPIDQPRLMLGNAGIIRLSPDDEVDLGLGICEGIETGLAIMAAGCASVWACGSLLSRSGSSRSSRASSASRFSPTRSLTRLPVRASAVTGGPPPAGRRSCGFRRAETGTICSGWRHER